MAAPAWSTGVPVGTHSDLGASWDRYYCIQRVLSLHIEAEFHFCNFNSLANPSGIFRNTIRWLFLMV